MIFGSGFDVLRSEKSQVEKFLPFTVLPKLRIGSNLTQSCMFKGWWECLKTFGIVCWYLVVSFLFFGVWRGVSFDLSDILGCQSCLGVFETHSMRDSVWLEPTHQFDPTLKNKMFFHLTLFEASKYQNLPICHFQKLLSFAIFLIFCICQREITIYSLFGSHFNKTIFDPKFQ